jgi:predicted MFS family arabinose efflux permease
MNSTPAVLTRGLTLLLGVAVGIIVANLYYAQPLIALIAKSLNLAPSAAGLIVTFTQMGYGLGVLLVVPLGDMLENRRLIIGMLVMGIFAVLGLALSTQMIPYFIAAILVGIGSSAVQIIVPYAAHLSPEATRGQVVGSLMSGLMLGIMLSRPTAGFLTDLISWHAVFLLSAGLMTILAVILYFFLPARNPTPLGISYGELLRSMGRLFVDTPILRRRAIYQACMFGAFCLFWTSSPLLLAGPEFHLSQSAIAVFALVGVTGAVSAPFAGRLADRGLSGITTAIALVSGILSFLLTQIFQAGSGFSLAFLVVAAILLDAGVSANLVLGQRAIFSLKPEHRGRLNGLYIATIFIGGAVGSSVGAWAFAQGGWTWTAWTGLLMPLAAFIYFLTEKYSTQMVSKGN